MSITTITVVHAPACHLCVDAQDALAGFGQEFQLRIEFVDAASDAGTALVGAHRPTMFPLVLVDGAFFSQGRLPRGKLLELLTGPHAVSTR